jgi:hypothetical protein
MRRTLAIVAAATALAGFAPATGGSDARTYRWMGSDTFNCGNWPKSADYTSVEKAVMLNWVLGFLSRASGESGRPDLLLNTDQQTVAAWLDTYCAAHPLDGVPTAAHVLQNELTARARGK